MTIEINDLEDGDLIQDLSDTELEVLLGGVLSRSSILITSLVFETDVYPQPQLDVIWV